MPTTVSTTASTSQVDWPSVRFGPGSTPSRPNPDMHLRFGSPSAANLHLNPGFGFAGFVFARFGFGDTSSIVAWIPSRHCLTHASSRLPCHPSRHHILISLFAFPISHPINAPRAPCVSGRCQVSTDLNTATAFVPLTNWRWVGGSSGGKVGELGGERPWGGWECGGEGCCLLLRKLIRTIEILLKGEYRPLEGLQGMPTNKGDSGGEGAPRHDQSGGA